MNKVIVEYYDDHGDRTTEIFEEVVGHQVGTGIVQVVKPNGVQRIINNFITIDVIPDEETQKQSLAMAEEAFGNKKEEVEESNTEQEAPKLEVVE